FCLIAMAVICSSTVRAQSRTFYIDAATGSNSNFGTQASPWKSAPGMQNNTTCSNNIVQHQSAGVNYSHQAGDHFLFKGGVTWPVACFQITITVGGASGNPDYWGVCVSNADFAAETNLPHGATNGSPCATGTSWPSAGWTRPKFDMAGSVPTGNNVIIVGSSFAGNVTFDNLEIANQGITITNTGVGSAYDFNTVSGSFSGVLIENNYIHDWVSNTDVSTLTAASNFYYSLGAIEDGHNRVDVDHDIIGDASGFVFAGATKKNGGFGGGCRNCKTVTNNTIHDGFAACFSTLVACAGNEIYGIHQPNIADCFGDSTCKGAGAARPHTQVVEDDFGAFSQVQVYNNYIHDNTLAGVTIYMNYSAQIYNNVMSNNANGNILIGRPGSGYTSLTGTGYVLNNTVDASNGTVCFATDGKATQPGPLVRNNNLCITNGNETSIVSTITSFTNGPNNYKMPTSEASSFGFVSSGKYKPSSSDSNVTAKGANLTSSCTGGLAVLCQDARGAPWFGGSPVTRPTGSTAWDLGAFMGQGGTTGPPTVTITSPSAGTVSGTQTLTATCTPQGTATCT